MFDWEIVIGLTGEFALLIALVWFEEKLIGASESCRS